MNTYTEHFMPVLDEDDAVYWIIPTAAAMPADMDGAVRCTHGGTIMVAECEHLTCDGGDACGLPAATERCTYGGTYYQPPEYETVCEACEEGSWPEPDDLDDLYYEHDGDCWDDHPDL